MRYQCYVVDPIAEYNMPQYKLREFKVSLSNGNRVWHLPQTNIRCWENVVLLSGRHLLVEGYITQTKQSLSVSQVTDARDGSSRTVRQFQFVDWPEQGVPKSGEGFIDFIGQVHKTKEQFGQDGPITVHCSAGVGRTGVFISLSIVLERMQYEGVLDVFQTVRILRAQRPAMVQTEVNVVFVGIGFLFKLGCSKCLTLFVASS